MSAIALGNTPAPTTYLKNCIDELDPKKATWLQCKATLLKVAAIATAILYVAACVAGVIACAFSLISAPLFVFSAFVAAYPVHTLYRKILSHSEANEDQAKALREIKKEYELLSPLSSPQMQERLTQAGIRWEAISEFSGQREELVQLKPLLARYHYWERERRVREDIQRDWQQEIRTHRDRLYILTPLLAKNRWQLMTAKINAAYALTAMQRPSLPSPELIYEIIPTKYGKQIFDAYSNDAFLRFKSGAALSCKQVTCYNFPSLCLSLTTQN